MRQVVSFKYFWNKSFCFHHLLCFLLNVTFTVILNSYNYIDQFVASSYFNRINLKRNNFQNLYKILEKLSAYAYIRIECVIAFLKTDFVWMHSFIRSFFYCSYDIVCMFFGFFKKMFLKFILLGIWCYCFHVVYGIKDNVSVSTKVSTAT